MCCFHRQLHKNSTDTEHMGTKYPFGVQNFNDFETFWRFRCPIISIFRCPINDFNDSVSIVNTEQSFSVHIPSVSSGHRIDFWCPYINRCPWISISIHRHRSVSVFGIHGHRSVSADTDRHLRSFHWQLTYKYSIWMNLRIGDTKISLQTWLIR